MEAQIEALRKEVRLTKWITIGGAFLSIALRFISPPASHQSPPINIGEASPPKSKIHNPKS